MPNFHSLPEPDFEPICGFTFETFGLAQRASAWIAIEGPSGSGKTTLCQNLLTAFEINAVTHTLVRYPGGTPSGEALRERLRTDKDLTTIDRVKLLAENRADIYDRVVAPVLNSDGWVLQDRSRLSAFVYQGIVEGAGLDTVAEIDKQIYGQRGQPDMTFVLWAPADVLAERVLRRAEQTGMPPGRFEGDIAKHKAVSDAYLECIRLQPNVFLIDGTAAPDVVFGEVMAFINNALLSNKIKVNESRADKSMQPESPDRLPPNVSSIAFPGTFVRANGVEP
jgi:dTMP kinase